MAATGGVRRKGVSKQGAFLAAFKITASITRAAAAAKIDRVLHYRWLAEDEEYTEAFRQAREEAAQALEDEAIRRAHEGWEEPVIYHGELCYQRDSRGRTRKRVLTVRKYSDQLLLATLKAWLPEKYRERVTAEHTGPDGNPIEVAVTQRAAQLAEILTIDELNAIRARLAGGPGDGRGGDPAVEPPKDPALLP